MAAGKSAAAAGDDKQKKKVSKKKSSSSASKKDPKSKSKSDKPASSSSSSKRTTSRDKDGAKKSSSKSKSATNSADSKSDELSPAAPASTSNAASSSSPSDATTTTPSTPLVHDPDAVQLFRRYDHARSGALSRRDFLELLRDYNGPPLSDTDARGGGVPLGLERSPTNSEFEAGQLFERYDGDHTGALSLDGFQRFFADFRSQLAAFARDVGYSSAAAGVTAGRPTLTSISASASVSGVAEHVPALVATPALATSAATPAPTPSTARPTPESSPSHPSNNKPVASQTSGVFAAPPPPQDTVGSTDLKNDDARDNKRKTLASAFQSALWKLRKILKDELLDQRERLLVMVRSASCVPCCAC